MSESKFERKRAAYTRRSRLIGADMGIVLHRRAMLEFVDRLMYSSACEGIDDYDLRTLVRMFNRECKGRLREQA